MTLKIFGRELDELVPYGFLAGLFVYLQLLLTDVASYTEITYIVGWIILLCTIAIVGIIKYEVERLREQVLAELRRGRQGPVAAE